MQTHTKSTKFCQYLCHDVLPQLGLVADTEAQTAILKLLGESCMFTGEIEDPATATATIYQKLVVREES